MRFEGTGSSVALNCATDAKNEGLSTSRSVELLDGEIVRRVKIGDLEGVRGLIDYYGMPPRRRYLESAIDSGRLEIVKFLLSVGVPLSGAVQRCLSAQRENPSVLRALIEGGANTEHNHLYSAIRRRLGESASVILSVDFSGQLLQLAADDLGRDLRHVGISSIRYFVDLVSSEGKKADVLEYALNGACRSGLAENVEALLEMGARGDRVTWRWKSWMRHLQKIEEIKRAFHKYGCPLPLPARFPLAFDEERANGKVLLFEASTGGLLDEHIISRPLLDEFGKAIVVSITSACESHDESAVLSIARSYPDILRPHYYLLEQVVGSGSLPLVRLLVDKLRVDVNQNDTMSLSMAAHEGYVDIIEYLIERGADVRALNDSALREASRLSNAEVVQTLLRHGADAQVYRGRPVYDCAMQLNAQKRSSALRGAKVLIDEGASPQAFYAPLGKESSPAESYLRFMAHALSPTAGLYLRALEPRIREAHLNLKDPSYRSNPIFRFASNCAAVASCLRSTPEEPDMFISLFKGGISKVLDERRGTFQNLAVSSAADIDQFQDISDVVGAVMWDVVVPILLMDRDLLPPNYSEAILVGADAVERVIARNLFKGRSINEILKLNRLWHRPEKQLSVSARPLRSSAEWHPLLERSCLGDGFTIEALTTAESLILEGVNLHHCVGSGGYAAQCLSGASHILSVRKGGVPLATVEVRPLENGRGELYLRDGRSVGITQARGSGNSRISREIEQRLSTFQSMVRTGQIRLNSDWWGETSRSINARRASGVTKLESVTGIKEGEFPELAVRHYKSVIRISATSKGEPGSSKVIGLLSEEIIKELVGLCRAEISMLSKQSHGQTKEVPLSAVTLRAKPHILRLIAWEFLEDLEHIRNLPREIVSNRELYWRRLGVMTGRPRRFASGDRGFSPHSFIE